MPDPLKTVRYRHPDYDVSPLSGLHTDDESGCGEFDVFHDQDEMRYPEVLEKEDAFIQRVCIGLCILIVALITILVLANSGVLPLSGKVAK